MPSLGLRFPKVLLLALLALLLGGCAGSRYGLDGSARDEDSNWRDLKLSGTNPVTRGSVEIINLVELMDPDGIAEKAWKRQNNARGDNWELLPWATKYDITMARFVEIHQDGAIRGRNLVQNRLMAAAERRCGRYIQFLRSDNTSTNFAFASAAGVLSTLGALISHEQSARTFSALGGMTSGLRAEYNNEFYSNLAISVIIRGITEKRRSLREDLEHKQQTTSYDRYDIAAAIRDAVEFDAACNVVNGLETANEAVQRLNEPGRDAMNRALLKQSLTNALAKGDVQAIDVHNKTVAALKLDPASVNARFLAAPDGKGVSAPRQISASADALSPIKSTRYVLEDLKQMLGRANSDLKAAAAEAAPANTAADALKTPTAALTQAVVELEAHITATFSATTPTASLTASCFAKAETLNKSINQLQSELQRKGESNWTVADRDKSERQAVDMAAYWRVLNRMIDATQNRIAAAGTALSAKQATPGDLQAAIDKAKNALKPDAWEQQLGELSCKKFAM
jgi:hypothetical protein